MLDYLPINTDDMEKRGWDQCDFVLVTGDAYVDHPSFGTAIISRVLELHGYKIGIIAQPSWKDTNDFKKLGRPKYGFLVNSGNIDPMVNHYSVTKRRRRDDAYSPGGKSGFRPDRATIVYCQRIREAYKNMPIIIGGLEASLRRLGHYDYWDDKIRRSILLDSRADLLIYGMGEKPIVEVVEALVSGIPIEEISFIKGTAYVTSDRDRAYEPIFLPTFDEIVESKEKYAESFNIQNHNLDSIQSSQLVEQYGERYVVQNTPQDPMTEMEMDRVYSLPYMRDYHPSYEEAGGIPAIKEVKFSLTNNRGCFGNCSFCALTFHQGRVLQSRSHESVFTEAEQIVSDPDFKGYIHDVGGPTANFMDRACEKQVKHGVCKTKQCLFPEPCDNLKIDHSNYLELLQKLRAIPHVKKVFVRSGIRYDYLIHDKDDSFFKELVEHHISGQLRVAPEHVSPNVLEKMGKPNRDIYDRFVKKYHEINTDLDKDQFLVPYLMSSHPGSTLDDAIELAEYLRDLGYMPEQVQDFYPTPSTLSTCIYYTGLDPRTMEPVYVPKDPHEKAMQRALIQYRMPQNYNLVLEALKKTNRMDLFGHDKKALIRPRKNKGNFKETGKDINKKNNKKAKQTRRKPR